MPEFERLVASIVDQFVWIASIVYLSKASLCYFETIDTVDNDYIQLSYIA